MNSTTIPHPDIEVIDVSSPSDDTQWPPDPAGPPTLAGWSQAMALEEMGFYEEALERQRGFYLAQIDLIGTDNQETLDARAYLVRLLHLADRTEEALDLLDEQIEEQKRLYYNPGLFMAVTLRARAEMLRDIRRYQESFDAAHHMLCIYYGHEGDNGFHTIDARRLVADIVEEARGAGVTIRRPSCCTNAGSEER